MWTVEPEVILGGPGTGKTTYAMSKVEALLGSGMRPQEIAFVSYTRKAVEEAKHRAADKFGLSRRAMDNFRTVHSLCYRDTGATRNTVMSRNDYRDVAAALGLRYNNRKTDDSEIALGEDGSLDTHLKVHQYARARMLGDRAVWEMLEPDFGWWEHERVLRTLSEYKIDNGKKDFSDLLTDYIAAAPPMGVRAAILDEAQDLSSAQWSVVHKAFTNVEQLFIAGDDDQAIYRWNGADVDQFVDLQGREHVLPHSHRLPRTVFEEAKRVVTRIRHRRDKQYQHTGKDGRVQWVNDIEDIPIEHGTGTWMLLARNKYQLHQFRALCVAAGVPYRTATGTSIDQDHVTAIVGWERLRSGKTVSAAMALTVVQYLGQHQPRTLQPKETYCMADFAVYGCTESRIWHDALFGISPQDTSYYLNVLRHGYSLTKPSPVYIGTIHSAKGGEADNVVLLTDLSQRSLDAYALAPDDECRVFYVGVTRARRALYLVTPQTEKFFPL